MDGFQVARRTFELENQVVLDDIYKFDEAEQQFFDDTKPWRTDPKYFTKVKVSAVALIKMVMHARSGGNIEIMGLMQGKILEHTFVIMDAFPLPVEGTETRVNAGASANEFMIQFMESSEHVHKKEHICGWYHSHPGYGCWLSGIDVQTQRLYQSHQEPFLAVVIDPTRTCSAGKVEIGAFRTFPENYTSEEGNSCGLIPLEKLEDFGVHWKEYYSLTIENFKSSLDATIFEQLWNKYWIDTLSSSPLIHNKQYRNQMIQDTVSKLKKEEAGAQIFRRDDKKGEDKGIRKVAKDCSAIAGEQFQGISSMILKHMLFNRACGCKKAFR